LINEQIFMISVNILLMNILLSTANFIFILRFNVCKEKTILTATFIIANFIIGLINPVDGKARCNK